MRGWENQTSEEIGEGMRRLVCFRVGESPSEQGQQWPEVVIFLREWFEMVS